MKRQDLINILFTLRIVSFLSGNFIEKHLKSGKWGVLPRYQIGQPNTGDLLTEYSLLVLLQIYVSKKWGFTKYEREKFEEMRAEGKLVPDGGNVQYKPDHGPLAAWKKVQTELAQL